MIEVCPRGSRLNRQLSSLTNVYLARASAGSTSGSLGSSFGRIDRVFFNLAIGLLGLLLLLFAKSFLFWLRDMLRGSSRLRRVLPIYEHGLRIIGAAWAVGGLVVLFLLLRA